MNMVNLMDSKILAKKIILEYLVENSGNLQDVNIIRCSEELDKLIVNYYKNKELKNYTVIA